MESKWLHDDDYEQDLYDISDFCTSAPVSSVNQLTKPNVHVRKARGKASIYEENYSNEDTVTPPKPKGRGSSLLWKNQHISPGGVPTFLLQQKETSKEIRMASSNGFGYCNDQIERMFQGSVTKPDVKPMDSIRLNLSPRKSPTSTNGSQSSNSDNPPVALYDIIKGKSPKPVLNGTENDSVPNIKSHSDFPRL